MNKRGLTPRPADPQSMRQQNGPNLSNKHAHRASEPDNPASRTKGAHVSSESIKPINTPENVHKMARKDSRAQTDTQQTNHENHGHSGGGQHNLNSRPEPNYTDDYGY